MQTISRASFMRASEYVDAQARPLDRERFAYYFGRDNSGKVVGALSAFQNPDGGFGHGLEPDFLLPDSSAMATSIAMRILVDLRVPATSELVRSGIQYLLSTFDGATMRWPSVPPGVNEYPHAPWWHYQEEIGGTFLDQTWGNPTAELLAHLLHYRELAPDNFLDSLYRRAIDYLSNHPDEMEMHELNCFVRLAENVAEADERSVHQKLTRLIMNTVALDAEQWRSYSAQPLDYVHSPDSFLYPSLKEAIDANLDFMIGSVSREGFWTPTWSWGQYEEAWSHARQIITGSLTVDRWRLLKSFDRIADGDSGM